MVKCWPLGKGSGASAVCGPFGISCWGCGEGLAGADEVDTMCVAGPGEGSREPQGVGRDQGRGVQKAGGEFREGLGAGEGQRTAGGTYTGDWGRLGKEGRAVRTASSQYTF